MVKCQQSGCNNPGIPHTFTNHTGKTWSGNYCPYHIQEIQRTIDKARKDSKATNEEKKKEKQKREQDQKNRQFQAFHCRQCNKKSTFYHYIYDKRTKKVEQTSSNASDPENQLVFCNENCYEKYFTTYCDQCGKSIKPGQNCYFSKKDSTIRFCSQSCGTKYLQKKQQEQIEEKLKRKKKKLEKLAKEAQEAADQLFDNLLEDIEAGKDINGYNWETADWLNDEQKEICRKYQQERNKPSSDSDNSNDLDEKTNDPADHNDSPTTPSGPTNNPEDNSGNNNDSPSPTNNDNTTPPQPWQPNQTTNNGQQKCGICDQTFTDADQHANENPQCQAFAKACEKILNQGQTVDYSAVATSERGCLIIETLQDLKIHKKWVDIDNLDLPAEVKESLKELRKQLGLYQNTETNNDLNRDKWGNVKYWSKILLPIATVVAIIIVLLKIRKKRLKAKKN